MAHKSGDTHFMSEAHRCARDLVRRPWPNPPVGAVVVRDGEIVARGIHQGPGTPHAEAVALEAAGERAVGATLYVTLEPCNHEGRTPPCAPLVADSGVARVVVGVRDPNPQVSGGGLRRLRQAGLEVEVGVLGRGCLELILPFVTTDGFTRSYVVLKTAQTADGFFAPAASEDPFYLTCEETLDEVHRQRRWCDLVLVGSGTVRADRPRLDGRRAERSAWCPDEDPAAGCIDTGLASAPAWRDDPFIAFAGEASASVHRARDLAARGVTVVTCRERDGHLDLHDVLAQSFARDWHVVMLEGGPTLAQAFLAAGLVDRWLQFVTPQVIGDGVRWPRTCIAPAAGALSLTRGVRSDVDALLVWDRLDFRALRKRLTRVQGGL